MTTGSTQRSREPTLTTTTTTTTTAPPTTTTTSTTTTTTAPPTTTEAPKITESADEPEAIAEVIVFLAGPSARIISGASIPVYGRA